MKALPKVVDLATATETDLAMAVDIATDTLGSFFPQVETTAEKMAALERVTNVLGLATTSSNMTLETMFETIKDVAPVMRVAGSEIEEFATLTGFMANAGIKGTKSATALKNIILRLANPVPKVRKQLRKMKVEIEDSNGNFLKLSKILDQVRVKTAKMGSRQRAAALDILFGKRAIAGASVIFEKADQSIEDFEKSLKSTGRTTANIAEDMRKSLGNRLAALKSSAIELGFKFIEEFTDPADEGIQGLTKSIRKFDVKPIVEGVKDIANKLGRAFDFIQKNKEKIKDVIKVFIVLKAAIWGAKGAMFALNAVMLTGPIGAVALAVGGLITALGIMVIDLQKAGFTWEHIWTGMELTVVTATNGIRSAFVETVNAIIRGLNTLIRGGFGGDAFAKSLGIQAPEGLTQPISEIQSPELTVGRARQERLEGKLADLEKKRVASQLRKLGVRGAASGSFIPGAGVSGQFAAGAEKSILGKGLSQDIGAQVAASLYGSNPQAPKQKVEGTIRFENPPPGMSFEGNVNGQPITSNVGAQ
jgi:TP901 family phage tail tape measure protein